MIDEIQNPEEFRFSQELLKAGLLTEAQMKTTLEYQRSLGGALRDIIVKLGFVDEKRLNAFVAKREHMPTIDLRNRVIDEETMVKVPRELIERHSVVPFRQSDGGILLAMVEPMDFEAVEEIQFLMNCPVETALAPRSQVLEALTRFYEENSVPDDEADEGPEGLIDRISDPVMAALVRSLVRAGIVDLEAWRSELELQG